MNDNIGGAPYDGTYFDSLEVEHIPKEIKKFMGNKNIIANINRIHEYESIICEYFWIGFIDFIDIKNCKIIQIY